MIRKFVIIFLILVGFNCVEVKAQMVKRYLVTFKDKSTTTYSLTEPEAFLSAASIERKKRYGITIDSLDIPVTKAYCDSLVKRKIVIVCRVKWFNSVVVEEGEMEDVVSDLIEFSFVKRVQYIGIYNKDTLSQNDNDIINSPVTLMERTMGYNYGKAYTQINMVGGDLMHEMGYAGKGINIAIFDAGFQDANNIKPLKPIFEEGRLIGTWNFIDNNKNVYDVTSGAHGTHVLSVMAAYSNSEMVGVAPEANYLLLRTEEGSGEYIAEEYYWAAAAAYADSVGIDIINSSLGYNTFDDSEMNHSYSDLDGKTTPISIAADIASRKGILVVSSAGNEGNKNWKYISAPADANNILAVGAVDEKRNYASFSSMGPTYDKRIKPEVSAMGYQTTVCKTDGLIEKVNGTSFSAPIIAGMSACLWQAFPQISNLELIDAIKKSASLFRSPNDKLGYGVPNYNFAYLMLRKIAVEQLRQKELGVYPNPITDKMQLVYFSGDNQQAEIQVFDIKGNKILQDFKSIRPNSYYYWQYDISKYKQGMYMFKIITDNGTVLTEKIVKTN